MMNEKRIHIYYINRIKHCQFKIFEAMDDDFANNRVVSQNIRAREYWLDKAKIFDKDLRFELTNFIDWSNDNCCKDLENIGWIIEKGKENL